MNTGRRTPRLSEKLQADMENLRSEHADLMASQLASFRTDLTTISDDALRTIQSDMDTQLLRLRRMWVTESEKRAHYRRGFSIPLIPAIVVLIIATTLGSALAIQAYRTSWQALGMERIERDNSIYLMLDPQRASVHRCTWNAEKRDCIKIAEE